MINTQDAEDDADASSMTESVGGTRCAREEVEREYVFKIVVVGDYHVGKTTLIKRLLTSDPTPYGVQSTHTNAPRRDPASLSTSHTIPTTVMMQTRPEPHPSALAESTANAACTTAIVANHSVSCEVEADSRHDTNQAYTERKESCTDTEVNEGVSSLNRACTAAAKDEKHAHVPCVTPKPGCYSECDDVEESTPTVGTDFYARLLPPSYGLRHRIRLQIWDTAGLPRFAAAAETTFRNASLILCVFDVTNKASLHHLVTRHLPRAVDHIPDLAQQNMVVVGNKTDLLQSSECEAAMRNYWRNQNPESAFVPLTPLPLLQSVGAHAGKATFPRNRRSHQQTHSGSNIHTSPSPRSGGSSRSPSTHTEADTDHVCDMAALTAARVSQEEVAAVLGTDWDEVNYCEVSARQRTGVSSLLHCICCALLRSVGLRCDASRLVSSNTAVASRAREEVKTGEAVKGLGAGSENRDDGADAMCVSAMAEALPDNYRLLAHSQLPLRSADANLLTNFAASSSSLAAAAESLYFSNAAPAPCKASDAAGSSKELHMSESWQHKGISFDLHVDPCALDAAADYSPVESSLHTRAGEPSPETTSNQTGDLVGVTEMGASALPSGTVAADTTTIPIGPTGREYEAEETGGGPPAVHVQRPPETDADGLHLREYLRDRFNEIADSHHHRPLGSDQGSPEGGCLRAPEPINVAAQYKKAKRKNKIKQICKCT